MNQPSHLYQVPEFPSKRGHLSECLAVQEWNIYQSLQLLVEDTPWPPSEDFPYCTCDDWSPT